MHSCINYDFKMERKMKNNKRFWPKNWSKYGKMTKMVEKIIYWPFVRHQKNWKWTENIGKINIFNITIAILDIFYCPVFYLKHNLLETEFCLSSCGTYSAGCNSLCLWTPATTIIFIKATQHKPPMRTNVFHTLNLHTSGA
jgi:hypothetical protein